MVGFGSSLRMSRRRGWEDAYLDYASLRLLLTQIEAVYEEEDWKARDSANSATAAASLNDSGGLFEDGIFYHDGHHQMIDSDVVVEDAQTDEEMMGSTFFPNVFQTAWEKTRSVVTGQPIISTTRRVGGGGGRYNKRRSSISSNRRQKQRIAAARRQKGSEYFEYSPEKRGRLVRRHHRHHHRSNTTSNNDDDSNHGHHSKSRGKEDTTNNNMGGADDQDNEQDDDYNNDYYNDRALDKGGWRDPGVLDYRDELFMESDDDLAFGYYYEEDEENEETEEDDDDDDEGEWIDDDEEEGNENVYQYNSHNNHDDNYYATGGFGGSSGYRISNGFMMGDDDGDDRFMLERHSSDDNSDIRAELAGTTSETISPHRLGRIDDGSINNNNNNNVNNRTPRHSFTSDPISNSNLMDTPERIVEFSESPGVLEAGYETFAAAAARRGDMGDAQAMYVGSPSEQGWFDFLPNLWGDKSKQRQQQQRRGESRPLLFNNEEESEDDPNYFDGRLIGENSPAAEDDGDVNHDDSSLGDSTHRYTSLRSKASPAPYLQVPRPPSLSHSPSTQGNEVQDEFESRFTYYGSSAFVEPQRGTSVPPLSPQPPPTRFRSSPVMATAIGSSMPLTPTTPPSNAFSKNKYVDESAEKGIVGFGVPIQMIPTEAVELLRPNSPRKSPTQSNFGSSQFYSFQNDNETEGGGNDGGSIESEGGDYYKSDSGFYSGGGRGGETYSLRSPPNRYSSRQQQPHHPTTLHPSLSSNAQTQHQFLSENPIMNLLLGRSAADWHHGGRNAVKAAGKKKKSKVGVRGRGKGHLPTSRGTSENSNSLPAYIRPSARQSRAAAAAKSKRARLRKKRRLRQQRREERVPHHLRAAHVRAAAITERFRGLLRAEVEKVILFANSRLGELSDTIGCLRYSSYEDGQDDRNAHPHLADGGIHQLSSSDEEDGGGHHHASDASSSSDGDAQNLDITIEHDAATRRQIIARDRLRMMRPLFQKADFLGEDFSLLSAVDEADAYTAVGVELMHLLKFVCVNIIAVRKICRKHDRLLSNRMVGGYYKKLAAEAKKSQSQRGYHHQFHWNEPQSGGTLSNPADAAITGGYIYGIYDTKIQHIANSTIMQTVSSSLSIALADFEASQSRSARLGLGFQPAKEFVNSSTPRQKSSSQSRGVLGYQLGGHSFGAEDDSSIEENEDENGSASSNIALTRLQFVVTSIFGLREAARIKVEPFEHYASRLFMISTGPNVVGDGLDGCSRETLDLLCSYNPDAAYTLDSETLYASLKIGRENVGVGSVMIASLAAATKGNDIISNNERCRRKLSAALCIKPQPAGEGDIAQSLSQARNRNILTLNTASMVLYLINYYCVVPIAHIHSTQLGSVSSSAVLIGSANVTAMLSSSIHAFISSKRKSFAKKNLDVAFFRTPLIVSAVFPLIGNVLYSMSVKRMSLKMALIGRLLVGLGSAEVLNRRLLSTVMPKESVNVEVARLVKNSMLAISAGLLMGALVDVQVRKHPGDNSYGISNFDEMNTPNIYAQSTKPTTSIFPSSNSSTVSQLIDFSIESIGIIMACLWFFQFVALLCFFDVPGRKDELDKNVNNSFENVNKSDLVLEEDFDSDSAGSENQKLSRRNSKPSFDSTGTNPFVSEGFLEEEEIGAHGTFEKLQVMSRKTVKTSYKGSYLQSIVYVSRLAMANVAFPTTLSILFLAKAVNEVLLSSCASIMNHYFGASGFKSGLFMGIMASCILPINHSFSSEKNFTERNIIKNALLIARYGIICIVNYEALFYTMKHLIFRSAGRDHSSSYDGFLGAAQYVFGFAVVFVSMVSLESVTLTVISKVSPIPLRKYTLDSSFVAIFFSALGRIAGDIVVWASELSSWLFFNSTINTLCFFLVGSLILGSFLVKKQYFFLI